MIFVTFYGGAMKGFFEKRGKFGFSAKHTVGFRGFPPMFHSHCEIITVIRGEINMRIDGKELTVRSGEISTVFPYVVHSYEDAPDTEFCIMLFDPETVGVFEKDLLKKKTDTSCGNRSRRTPSDV